MDDFNLNVIVYFVVILLGIFLIWSDNLSLDLYFRLRIYCNQWETGGFHGLNTDNNRAIPGNVTFWWTNLQLMQEAPKSHEPFWCCCFLIYKFLHYFSRKCFPWFISCFWGFDFPRREKPCIAFCSFSQPTSPKSPALFSWNSSSRPAFELILILDLAYF